MHDFSLQFGRSGRFDFQVEPSRLLTFRRPPKPIEDVSAAVAAAVASPLDFPPLAQAVVPGDRVLIALDRDTPEAARVVASLWSVLEQAGVRAADVLILHPADLRRGRPADPRASLPASVQSEMGWKLHHPEEDQVGYLATTAGGDRIYLGRDLLDADLVLCVGAIEFDSALGYRGTQSVLYPGMSNLEALRKLAGAAHEELQPDDPRPIRELADEVGWLLGVQFALQVIPSEGAGISAALAGLAEPVFQAGKSLLAEQWRIDVPQRPELVIAAVDQDAGGHSWRQVAAALETARRIVARDGRILLLTELEDEPTPGIELIRDARTPREAIKPIRQLAREDRIEALQIAQALDRANVFLLSRLADDLVEDLFMVPLSNLTEAARVVEGTEACAVLGSAQHVFVQHIEPGS